MQHDCPGNTELSLIIAAYRMHTYESLYTEIDHCLHNFMLDNFSCAVFVMFFSLVLVVLEQAALKIE